MTDGLVAYGRPYDRDGLRVLFCQQGATWCGWLRTSNNEKQHLKYTAEREGHETTCTGGGL
jgi:hypothetical protein